ncbi:fumarylacetoacetate hydrolase family protein [Flammeovirga kamogawensis]|uniref:Fumarylacetoacetate hydrolase family protein n=1 Tax=Flammeovirga kamogawensis TaxID=373891 RepID=A0ABX8GX73_9BACT|nr:fumarylacetoacetate hydrolase family protein [Flammeovirga kamogawensis]MBB6460643.1 2-keto-4-pentenoate hydratase/2-oxohepta-3-ene-1,7-dioic acid hydratase in catechol pathway [Flammeovirga kamogawensis]QWG07998.1 fumarylacetoacetate hydrolase family protein [Flammeovirga kamogawensis]TRX69805.1 fumarylacetoacetate hydrolase family protein [Flammeovirga kamogawensis]
MKIICIGRNYVDHIAELNNERPTEPVIFTKPETAVLKNNDPFYYPEFSNDIHHEVELVVKICKGGKYIQEKFAHRYYEEVGLGIDFTARDVQSRLKAKGLPWELAKAFNDSAPISKFQPIANFKDIQDINFSVSLNGEEKQSGNSSMMLWNVNEIIAFVSKYITLKKGDFIFTGTPKGVGPVKIGDRIEGFIEGEKLLDFEVK